MVRNCSTAHQQHASTTGVCVRDGCSPCISLVLLYHIMVTSFSNYIKTQKITTIYKQAIKNYGSETNEMAPLWYSEKTQPLLWFTVKSDWSLNVCTIMFLLCFLEWWKDVGPLVQNTQTFNNCDCIIPTCKISFWQTAFSLKGTQQWNGILESDVNVFNRGLKRWLKSKQQCPHK